MGPKTIVPRKGRPYANGEEWKGAGYNGFNGEPENGLEGYLFERFIGVEASKAKAGGVLDPHKKKTMTLDMRKVFEKNMITLQESIAKEASPDKMASLKEGADAIRAVYKRLRAIGWTIEHISFDKASEVGADFIDRLNRNLSSMDDGVPETVPVGRDGATSRAPGIRVTKQPAEAYEKHVEAHWRTLLRDFSNALLSQNTLKAKQFWVSCLLDCINRRNCAGAIHQDAVRAHVRAGARRSDGVPCPIRSTGGVQAHPRKHKRAREGHCAGLRARRAAGSAGRAEQDVLGAAVGQAQADRGHGHPPARTGGDQANAQEVERRQGHF